MGTQCGWANVKGRVLRTWVYSKRRSVRRSLKKETDIFTLSWHEDLAAGDGTSNHAHNHCFDAEMDTTYGVKALAFWQCHGDFGNQLIKYLPNTQVNKNYVTIT